MQYRLFGKTHAAHTLRPTTLHIPDLRAFVHQSEVENTVIVDVPDAHAAQRKQRELIDKNGGTYDKDTNSCVTHVGDVLRAGGRADVPGTTRETVRWLVKNGKRQ